MLARVLSALLLGLAACSGEADDPPVLPARGANDAAAATPPSALDAVRAPEPIRTDPAPPLDLEAGDVVVTVVRRDGAPAAGVPVLGCDVDEDGAIEGRLRWGLAIETDAFGRAVLPERRTGERYAAALFGGVPALSTADAPAHIVLPPTGSILVDLEPSDCPADLRIVSGLHGGRAIELEVPESGVLDIPRVPLGDTYEVEVRSNGAVTAVRLLGPREASEVVRLSPELCRILTVSARVVDLDGTPCSADSVVLRTLDGRKLTELERAGERFEGRLTSTSWGTPDAVLLIRSTGATVDPQPFAIVPVPESVGRRVVDLGTVELTPLPTIVAGRVVDTAGNAVSGAFVQARLRPAGAPSAPWVPPHPSLTAGVGFGLLSATVAVAGPDGRFELCAHPVERWAPGDVLDLRVRPRGSADFPRWIYRSAHAGDLDVRIVVQRKGSFALDASDLHPDVAGQVHATIRRADGVGEPRALGRLDTRCETQVEAGTYDVDFILAGQPLVGAPPRVGTLEGVVVPPDAPSSDERLAPLELPFEPIVRSVRVVDPDRVAVGGVELLYRGGADGVWVELDGFVTGGEGRFAWIDVPGSGVRAAVRSIRNGSALLSGRPDGAVVTLPGLVEVELTFEGNAPPRPHGRLRLVSTDAVLPPHSARIEVEEATYRANVQAGVPYVFDTFEPWLGAQVEAVERAGQVTVRPPAAGEGQGR